MMTESGRVVAIEHDAVWVETIRRSSCQSCAVQKGCGHGLLASAGQGRSHHVRVLLGTFQPSDLQIDDEVQISIPEHLLVSGTVLLYLLPLLTLLAGAYLSSRWLSATAINTDVAALLGAVAGFVLGLLVARLYSVSQLRQPGIHPVLSAILPPVQGRVVVPRWDGADGGH